MTTPSLARALKPTRLGPRGKALWTAMTKDGMPAADVVVLIVEACHLVDRLDRLSAVVDGDGDDGEWAHIRIPRNAGETEFTLVVNGAMAEARQTGQVLRLTLAQIGKAEPPAKEGGSFLDELASKRRDRTPATPAV